MRSLTTFLRQVGARSPSISFISSPSSSNNNKNKKNITQNSTSDSDSVFTADFCEFFGYQDADGGVDVFQSDNAARHNESVNDKNQRATQSVRVWKGANNEGGNNMLSLNDADEDGGNIAVQQIELLDNENETAIQSVMDNVNPTAIQTDSNECDESNKHRAVDSGTANDCLVEVGAVIENESDDVKTGSANDAEITETDNGQGFAFQTGDDVHWKSNEREQPYCVRILRIRTTTDLTTEVHIGFAIRKLNPNRRKKGGKAYAVPKNQKIQWVSATTIFEKTPSVQVTNGEE